MVVDLDIYRAASLLIKQYGADDATFQATRRADEMLTKGDLDGVRTWTQIVRAIYELSATARPRGAASH